MALALTLTGCGGDAESPADEVQLDASAPEVSFKPGPATDHTVKPQGPVQISYRIIGTPIVGQPIAIDLQVQSVLGPQEVTLSFRINDSTAMQFPEAQPASVSKSWPVRTQAIASRSRYLGLMFHDCCRPALPNIAT